MYHCEIKIISRTAGRSAVAAAAYRSCSRLVNERDGEVHDFRIKSGLVDSYIALPENAPSAWLDRSTLWNAAEKIERAENAQVAREFELALNHELGPEGMRAQLREFVDFLTALGMVCDVAIHDPGGDGHNVHAHIMTTMRSCDENGFLPKSVNLYTARRAGEEREMTAAEFRDAKAEGWEKVYKFRKGNEWRELTASEAKSWEGCKRGSKTPVQRGRYLNDWNDSGNAEIWRAKWAEISNKHLALAGSSTRVDHRSNARRGIEYAPTVHEGPYVTHVERAAAAKAEALGLVPVPVTDRRRENIAIRAANAALAAARKLSEQLAGKLRAAYRRRAFLGREKARALGIAALKRGRPAVAQQQASRSREVDSVQARLAEIDAAIAEIDAARLDVAPMSPSFGRLMNKRQDLMAERKRIEGISATSADRVRGRRH